MNIDYRGMRQSAAVIVLLNLASFSIAQETAPLRQDSQPVQTVKLSLIVTDRSGHGVDDVVSSEVKLSEDNLAQTIKLFAKEDKPVDYAIAIDTSGSFKPLLPSVVEAVKLLINNQNDADELFLERFTSSDKIERLQDFTSDKATLLKTLTLLYIESGQSAVIDGIYLAVQHVVEHSSSAGRRRAVVVFTDGEDRASYYSQNELLQLVRKYDVQVFVVGLLDELDNDPGFLRKSPRDRAEKLLKSIAQETGARMFEPKKKKELFSAVAELSHDLHSQYAVAYESNNPSKEAFRAVKVEIAESPTHYQLTAITRPGYYIGQSESEPKDKKKKPKKPTD